MSPFEMNFMLQRLNDHCYGKLRLQRFASPDNELPYLRMYRPHISCLKFKGKNGVRLIFEITSNFILKKLYS
jgi:hypothetical protein